MRVIKTIGGVAIHTTAEELRNLADRLHEVETGAPVIVHSPGQTLAAAYYGDNGTEVSFHTTKPKG